MALDQTPRNFVNRLRPRRRIQRLEQISGADSSSEQAIRSIREPRSTFRW